MKLVWVMQHFLAVSLISLMVKGKACHFFTACYVLRRSLLFACWHILGLADNKKMASVGEVDQSIAETQPVAKDWPKALNLSCMHLL